MRKQEAGSGRIGRNSFFVELFTKRDFLAVEDREDQSSTNTTISYYLNVPYCLHSGVS